MAKRGRPPKPILKPKRMKLLLVRRLVDVAFAPPRVVKIPGKRAPLRFDVTWFQREQAIILLMKGLFREGEFDG